MAPKSALLVLRLLILLLAGVALAEAFDRWGETRAEAILLGLSGLLALACWFMLLSRAFNREVAEKGNPTHLGARSLRIGAAWAAACAILAMAAVLMIPSGRTWLLAGPVALLALAAIQLVLAGFLERVGKVPNPS